MAPVAGAGWLADGGEREREGEGDAVDHSEKASRLSSKCH